MRTPSVSAALALSVAVVAFAPAAAGAQEFAAKAGLNIANLSFIEEGESIDLTRRNGLVGGLAYVYRLREPFAIHAEGLLTVKGAKSVDERLRLTYLEFPAMGRVDFRQPAGPSLFLFSGPTLAFKLDASLSRGATSEDVDDEYKPVDVGWVLGGGVELQGLTLDIRFTWGLRNQARDFTTPEEGSLKNRVFSILVGLPLSR